VLVGSLLHLAACGTAPAPADDPVLTAEPDTVALLEITSGDSIPDLLPEWPPAPDGAADPVEWEVLYREALAAASRGRLGEARDRLFVLQDWAEQPAPADADTLYLQHRRSLQRRVMLLGGLLAEQSAYAAPASQADSLLTAEYLGLRGAGFPDSLVPATGTRLPELQADLLKVQHGKVDRWVDYFTGRGRRYFQVWLDRKAALDSLITARLADHGLPADLIYLAMIESGLSTRARSNVGAVGPWQFMPATGRRYGLRIDWWRDERRDLERATDAAARYLTDLHDEFGDWALVLAAYNSGEGRVRRQLRTNGHDNFWDYRLPRQTVEYVPKFIAAARIGADPEAYGFTRSDVPSPAWETVTVDEATDLGLVAECAGVDAARVVELNPELLRRATPPGVDRYEVRVPAGTADRTAVALRKVPADRRLTWRKHEVRRGETLSHVAASWGTSVRAIQEANGLGRSTLIHPGDQLLVPMPRELSEQARARAERAGRYLPPQGYERITYRVRQGDTLGAIARRLGVSITHLKKVNGIKDPRRLQIGQRLAAYRPPASS
jgi:membrane-bound lytic murein transglycosylase D